MNTSSNTIKYNGPDFKEIGVQNGMSLNDVLSKLNDVILTLKSNEVSLGPEEKPLPIKDAVLTLNERLSKIKAEDVLFESMPSFPNALSYDAVKVKSEKITVNYDLSGSYLVFTFDYSPFTKYGNSFIYKTRLYGKNVAGNILTQENNQVSGTISIPIEAIPAFIDISILIKSPNGDISLSNTQNVFSAHKRTEQVVFDVKDFMSSKQSGKKLTDYLENMFSRVNEVSTIKDVVDKYEVSDLENIPNQKGMLQIVSTLLSFSDTLKSKTDSLDKINIPGRNTELSIQSAFDLVGDMYAGLTQELKKKDDQILALNQEVIKLQGFYSSIVNSQSGGSLTLSGGTTGSGSGPGGCFGAGCGGSTITIETPPPDTMNTSITPTEVYDATINSFIQNGVSFIDFYMSNCGPCQQMEMTVGLLNGSFNKETQTVNFGKINVTNERQSAQNYVIGFAPTFIIFKNGIEVERIEGVNTFEFIRAKIQSYL